MGWFGVNDGCWEGWWGCKLVLKYEMCRYLYMVGYIEEWVRDVSVDWWIFEEGL